MTCTIIKIPNIIGKRFMQTSSRRSSTKQPEATIIQQDNPPITITRPTNNNTPITEQPIQEIHNDETSTQINPTTSIAKEQDVDAMLTEIEAMLNVKTVNNSQQNSNGNLTVEVPKEHTPLYTAPDLTKEALLTNVAIRTTVAALDDIATQLNKQIEHSDQLTEQLNKDITNLDNFIKSLSSLPWKRLATYSACILVFLGFMWKMGAMRALPNFGLKIIAGLANAISSTSVPSKELTPSKDSLENGFKVIMDTPLSPPIILMSIGGISLTIGVLKAFVWIIRKAPK